MITNVKDYYRRLDAFLSEIYQVGAENIFSTVLRELVGFLGKDLRIKNGRLYELIIDEFVLVYCTNIQEPDCYEKLDIKSEAVQLVLKHGTYIYHDSSPTLRIRAGAYADPLVAFTILRGEEVWLFVFELYDNWDREEIEFSVNTTRKLLNARISSESMKDSLLQAELIQRSLLPKSAPQIDGFDIYGKSIPAELVGGDLYDYYSFSEGHFGVGIGDAIGHGLPAALLARDVVTGLRMGLEKEMKISAVIQKLNRVIHRSTLSTSFTSLFYAEIETTGDLVYVNAGHPDPILVHGQRIQLLKRGGTVLGPLPEIQLKRGFAFMPPGSLLVLYSDGLIERRNIYGETFGQQKLKELVINNQNQSAEKLVTDIIDVVYNFGNQQSWKDDLTVVIVKRKP
ncbi:MAG: PP2C family protein-serine/threonine phosphatase [bacterium]|nr:PP2C family protein-serine/threonine phosphatase [bacterium]